MSPELCLGIYPMQEDMSSAHAWITTPPPLRETPGYRETQRNFIKAGDSQTALQGGLDPSHDGVFTTMPDKSIKHGVLAGIIKSPFYI